MDKNIYNQMSIKQQLDYINKELLNNKSLSKISEELDISRKTISNRFKNENYIFDKKTKQYVINNKKNLLENSQKSDININKNKENLSEICEKSSNGEITISINEKEVLSYLTANFKLLENIINNQNREKDTSNTIETFEDVINDLYKFKQTEREYISKTFKIDVNIAEKLDKVSNRLKSKDIKQRDLLNFILDKYMLFIEDIEKSK